MTTINKTAAALMLASAVMASQAANADSIIALRKAGTPDFHKFLPELPADVPWLTAVSRNRTTDAALPEAGSVSALMFVPKPAEAWAALTTQPVALRPAPGCKQCRQH